MIAIGYINVKYLSFCTAVSYLAYFILTVLLVDLSHNV